MTIEFRDNSSGQHLAKPLFRSGKKYGQSFQFIPLENQILFVNTHYARSRTIPCKGKDCLDCKEHAIRERAYIAVIHVSRKMAGVLEMTSKAGTELKNIAMNCEIVGMVMKLDRVAGNAKGSLTITPSDQIVQTTKFQKDWTTISAICAVWGVDDPTIAGRIDIDPTDPRVSGDFAADAFKMPEEDGNEGEETEEGDETVAA